MVLRPKPRSHSLTFDQDLKVHALFDGGLAGVSEDYHNIHPRLMHDLLREAGQEVPPRPDLICYLIEAAGQRILVDAGAGRELAEGGGALLDSLAVVDVGAGDVDTIFLTHLHGDHVGGLIDSSGGANFPNAKIVMYYSELKYWLESKDSDLPSSRLATRDFARKCLTPYQSRVTSLGEADIASGVKLLALPGHTPGHAGLIVGSQSRRLYIVGDILHLPEIQLAHPEVTTRYDWDESLAASTRQLVLERAHSERALIAGMHFRWPGFSRVSLHGGKYVLTNESDRQDALL